MERLRADVLAASLHPRRVESPNGQRYAWQLTLVAWTGFTSPAGDAAIDTQFRRDERIVREYPQFLVDADIPQREWPSVFDQVIEDEKQRHLAAEPERRERFEADARRNAVPLSVSTFRARRDFFATVAGLPALVRNGSTVVVGNPLLLEHADEWEPAR